MLKKYLLFFSFIFAVQLVFADVPNEIRYNGKLKEYRTEVNATKTMNFKIYDQLTGGTAKWESGNKSVVVSSGIFSTILSPNIDWRGKDYYLEIEIDSKKLEPREKLTAVPYSLHSNTTEKAKVKTGSEFSVMVGEDKRFIVNSDGAKTTIGITEYYMVPKGAIIIWSGALTEIPVGWALCDGTNGTPDLRGRFVLGAGNTYSVGSTGGEETHTLTIEEMPSHSHEINRTFSSGGGGSGGGDINTSGSGKTPFSLLETGGSQSHNNMPPYYCLCYIMKK